MRHRTPRPSLLAAAAIAAAASCAFATPANAAHPAAGHPADRGAGHPMIPGPSVLRPDVSHPSVSSTNWSGYAAINGTYSSVSASWTEPTGHCGNSPNSYSSFWVGLDGYSSGSVEQTGSEVDCNGTTPVYYSWYEMYPAYPVNFSNTVRPGDHFNASVTYTGSNNFRLVLSDTTQGWSHTINKTLSGAARSSAEVIVEAPSSTFGVLPLADFGSIGLTGSSANGQAIGSFNPTEITMVNGSGQPKDSISGLSGGTSFTATWLRSN
jgi:hypothetical protein